MPLTVFAMVVIFVEVLSIMTDSGARVRRELLGGGRATLRALGIMEQRGIQIRQSISATEASGSVRGLMLRYNIVFWGFVLFVALVSSVFAWSWWIPAVVIGIVLAVQTIDLQRMLGQKRVDEASSAARVVWRAILHTSAGVMIVTGVLTLGWGLDPRMPAEQLWWRVAAAVAGVTLLYLAIWIRRVAERVGAVVNEAPRFGEDASRNDVLLLRSFKDDELLIRAVDPVVGRLGLLLGYRVRFEEYIANLLTRERRLIAIGKPGEALPALGAVRTYFPDDEWQDAIDATVRRVGTIVMVAAGTGGFEWELNLLRRTGHLSKTLILIPPIGPEASVTRMQDILVRLGLHTLTGFKSDEWDEWGFAFLFTLTGIGFTAEGKPVFYLAMGRDWAAYAGTTVSALEYLSGRSTPPEHGAIARQFGLDL